MEATASTVTVRCECGTYLRGTVERERPPRFDPPYHDASCITASQIMATCPKCGRIGFTPLEITSSLRVD